mmetsp:Transcript_2192/g.3365  ORF Transcript_2192/g.3365 Transcript_2192/m.3365 type:complete len:205 (-) Transcript_2192:182-796(-)
MATPVLLVHFNDHLVPLWVALRVVESIAGIMQCPVIAEEETHAIAGKDFFNRQLRLKTCTTAWWLLPTHQDCTPRRSPRLRPAPSRDPTGSPRAPKRSVSIRKPLLAGASCPCALGGFARVVASARSLPWLLRPLPELVASSLSALGGLGGTGRCGCRPLRALARAYGKETAELRAMMAITAQPHRATAERVGRSPKHEAFSWP